MVPSHSYFLIGGSAGTNGVASPRTPDVVTGLGAGAGNGQVFLADTTSAINPVTGGACVQAGGAIDYSAGKVIDFFGYGPQSTTGCTQSSTTSSYEDGLEARCHHDRRFLQADRADRRRQQQPRLHDLARQRGLRVRCRRRTGQLRLRRHPVAEDHRGLHRRRPARLLLRPRLRRAAEHQRLDAVDGRPDPPVPGPWRQWPRDRRRDPVRQHGRRHLRRRPARRHRRHRRRPAVAGVRLQPRPVRRGRHALRRQVGDGARPGHRCRHGRPVPRRPRRLGHRRCLRDGGRRRHRPRSGDLDPARQRRRGLRRQLRRPRGLCPEPQRAAGHPDQGDLRRSRATARPRRSTTPTSRRPVW